MDEALRKKIEAALFAVGKKVHIDQLTKMIKEKDKGKVVACLIELKQKYNTDEDNSLMVLQDGEEWKLTIKDQYIDIAKDIGIETELSKTVMETLAVIAYKHPAVQSDVIKVRTNKAYDHLKELEELGYISRKPHGRSKLITLTPKFFDYFDLPPEALKERFANVNKMEQAIKDKEHQIEMLKEKQEELRTKQKQEERKMERTNIFMSPSSPSIQDIVKHDPHGVDIIIGQRLGDLEVVDEPLTEEEQQELEKQKQETPQHKEEEEKLQTLGACEVYEEPPNYIHPGIEEDAEEERSVPANLQDDIEEEKEATTPLAEEAALDKDFIDESELEEMQNKKDTLNLQDETELTTEQDETNSRENTPESEQMSEDQDTGNTLDTHASTSEDVAADSEGDATTDALETDAETADTEHTAEDSSQKDDKDIHVDADVGSKETTASQPDEDSDESNTAKAQEEEKKQEKTKEQQDDKPEQDEEKDTKDLAAALAESDTTEGFDEPFGEESSNEQEEEDEPEPLKEDKLFNMDDIPPSIMKRIDEEVEEILGEKKKKRE